MNNYNYNMILSLFVGILLGGLLVGLTISEPEPKWDYEWANTWENKVHKGEGLDFGDYHGDWICDEWEDPNTITNYRITLGGYLGYMNGYTIDSTGGYTYELTCKHFMYFTHNEMVEWFDDTQFKLPLIEHNDNGEEKQ